MDLMTDDGVRLVDIQGLGAECTISTSATAGKDGETITSNSIGKRNITIVLRFRNTNAEADKIRLYKIFKLKSVGTLQIISAQRAAKIEYYVEKVDVPPNVYPLKAQVSLICPGGYFEALEETRTQLAGIVSRFRLPFHIPVAGGFKIAETSADVFTAIINASDVISGAEFVLYASSAVVNPAIENVNTGEKMQLNYTMAAGDIITISTHRGNKRITLIRDNVASNLTNYKVRPFTFLQLAPGDNILKRDADSNVNGLFINCYHKTQWGAV